MYRPAALLVSGLVLLARARLGGAAAFGVPSPASPTPHGYLMLVSPDAIDPARSDALGDIGHTLTFYIESPARGLQVDLYDPGSWSPSLPDPQLDINVTPPPGPITPAQVRYVLLDPTRTLVANQTFGADTAATDQRVVNLYNSRTAPPGLYELDVSLLDDTTLASEQDIEVFGISVPGCQVYTYNLTGGELNQGGATITEPVSAFPWLTQASPGSDAFGPVCGAAFISYDLDAAVSGGIPMEPPDTDVSTRRGYVFPAGQFPPSGDARWSQTDNGGLNFGLLDSNDQGIWRWDFNRVTRPEDVFGSVSPPLDLNCFSIQILDYGAPARDVTTWPSLPPFGDGNPRRLYLPEDDGSAPQREWLGHSATVVGGFPVVAQGQTSTLEVTIELGNPHAYPLTNVVGESHVVSDPQITAPVLVGSSGGLTATITNDRIDFAGTVAAGTTGTVVYRVDITPTGLGRGFLTGDGSDFVAPGAPTTATYQTPYTPSTGLPQETLGPVCQIQYESVVPSCEAVAHLTAERTQACPGTPIRLDGLQSQVVNCAGGVPIYEWSVNGTVAYAFPAADTITVTPFLNDTWTLEVACSTDQANCNGTDQVTFDLYPALNVDVGADRTVCPGNSTSLTATVSNGTPPISGGTWSTSPAGQAGDGSTNSTITVAPTATTVYTYTAQDSLGCTGSAHATVTVDVPTPAISPPNPVACPSGTVTLAADAGYVSYLWNTSPRDPGADRATTQSVVASQVGTTYTVTVTDANGCTGSAQVTVGPAPPLSPSITPPNPQICGASGSVGLTAEAGFATYLWSTNPVDPAVQGSTSASVTASQVGTTYTVSVTDSGGCSGSTSVVLTTSADPIPGPVGPTLRVTKQPPDVHLSWTDLVDPASGYEAVFLECPTVDYRTSCGGRVPDVPTMTAAPTTGAPVAVGTQTITHANALALGKIIFYDVRALSPCTSTPGPVN